MEENSGEKKIWLKFWGETKNYIKLTAYDFEIFEANLKIKNEQETGNKYIL